MRWFLVYQKSRGLGGLWGILLVFGGLIVLVVVGIVPFFVMLERFRQFPKLAAVFPVEIPDQWANKKNHRDDEDTRKLE